MEPPSTVGGQKLQFCMCQSFKKHMAQSLKRRLSSHNASLHVQTPPLPQVPQVWVLLQAARPLWKPGHQSTHGQPLKIICNFWVFGICLGQTATGDFLCLSLCMCLKNPTSSVGGASGSVFGASTSRSTIVAAQNHKLLVSSALTA